MKEVRPKSNFQTLSGVGRTSFMGAPLDVRVWQSDNSFFMIIHLRANREGGVSGKISYPGTQHYNFGHQMTLGFRNRCLKMGIVLTNFIPTSPSQEYDMPAELSVFICVEIRR